MDSIQPKTLREIADGAAFRSGLLWRLQDLRAKALEAYRTAETSLASLGLPPKQIERLVLSSIHERVEEAAGSMDRLPPDQSQPTTQQIRAALEAFSTKQWTPLERWPPPALSPPMEDWPVVEARFGLMERLGRAEVEALLDHIRHDEGDLAQRIGARKLEAIEGQALMRHTQLTLPEDRSKMVAISDPHWAAFWREQARHANREGRGRPAKGRSRAEQVSDRRLAERLSKRDEQTGREMKVTRHQVKEWRARMEELPYEQYASEVGAESDEERAAAFLDYVTMIRADHRHGRK
jgi:hypothetical protein